MMANPLIQKMGDRSTSSFKKYQELAVGSESIFDFVKYELLMSLFGSFPGALGIYLRSKAIPLLLRKSGKGVLFGRNVTIRVPKRIELGSNVIVDDNSVLDAKGDPGRSFIRCGNDVEISRNTILSCKGQGSINLGNFVSIGRNVLLSAFNELVIEDKCSIGPYCAVLASGHGWEDPETPILLQDRKVGKIVIGENVWLGAHVTVMDGVTIGRNSVVGAGSVVTQDIPPYRIAGGMPARVIARRGQEKAMREGLNSSAGAK